MPIRLSKPALAALGALKQLAGGTQEDDDISISEETQAAEDGSPMDDLVELGEEFYDELLLKLKNRRDRLEARFRKDAAKVFSGLGLVTRDDIRNMKDSLDADDSPKSDKPDEAG